MHRYTFSHFNRAPRDIGTRTICFRIEPAQTYSRIRFFRVQFRNGIHCLKWSSHLSPFAILSVPYCLYCSLCSTCFTIYCNCDCIIGRYTHLRCSEGRVNLCLSSCIHLCIMYLSSCILCTLVFIIHLSRLRVFST